MNINDELNLLYKYHMNINDELLACVLGPMMLETLYYNFKKKRHIVVTCSSNRESHQPS